MSFICHDVPSIDGLKIIEPSIINDERGAFFEFYRDDLFKVIAIDTHFVQENVSISHKNVLRGLHFQKGDHAQAKLITVLQGSIYDVAVDLRPQSATLNQWYAVELSSNNRKMFYIPKGFAHGFLSLEDNSIVHYRCDCYYNRQSEGFYRFDHELFNIKWPINSPILSLKDSALG